LAPFSGSELMPNGMEGEGRQFMLLPLDGVKVTVRESIVFPRHNFEITLLLLFSLDSFSRQRSVLTTKHVCLHPKCATTANGIQNNASVVKISLHLAG